MIPVLGATRNSRLVFVSLRQACLNYQTKSVNECNNLSELHQIFFRMQKLLYNECTITFSLESFVSLKVTKERIQKARSLPAGANNCLLHKPHYNNSIDTEVILISQHFYLKKTVKLEHECSCLADSRIQGIVTPKLHLFLWHFLFCTQPKCISLQINMQKLGLKEKPCAK